jgi:penicillin-binding protein 1C
VPFTAVTDSDTRRLFWFVDDHFLGETPRDQPLFWLMKPGNFSVRVVDDQGRADVRAMVVNLIPVAQ